MILVRLFRFLRGYVEFEVWGGFSERFLNLCARAGIDLWGVRNKGDRLIARVDVRSYRRLHRPAHRSGMRLHARYKRGLPFLSVRYRRRAGVLIGLLAAVLLVSGLTPFLWTVQVEGASPQNELKILQVFEELGVHSGVRASGINVDSVVLQAYSRLPELSWMALNLNGCNAVIEVRENVPVPELSDDETPGNVIAQRDGQIIRIQPYAGTPQADPGSAVVKGDLLISGAVERKDGGVTFVHAQGDAYARTKRTIEVFVPFRAAGTVQERVGSRYRIGAFFLNIPIGRSRQGEGITGEVKRTQLVLGGVRLPIFVERTTYYRTHEADFTYVEEEALMLAVELFSEEYGRLAQEAQITGGTPEVTVTQEGCKIVATFSCEENIAQEAPIEMESSPESTKNP